MADNPLFSQANDKDKKAGYVLSKNNQPVVAPKKQNNAAAELVRKKLAKIYADEPSATEELEQLAQAEVPPSKHQLFLQELQQKVTSVADIQTKWHKYYTELPENEKHEVWREFYAQHAQNARYAQFTEAHRQTKQPGAEPQPHKHDIATPTAAHKRLRDARTAQDIKQGIKHKIDSSAVRDKHHPLRSLFFGASIGVAMLAILLFGLFNEMVVAPFIQPSRNVSATPVILDNDGIAADGSSKIIIPKINVEIPVDYGLTSMAEDDVQKGLENGIVHYPSTVAPGEIGNAAFFGHSSNNIFNPGKYKFAFVMLSNLQAGDIFYLTHNKKVYTYKVFDKKVVNPDETWVLNSVEGKSATAALITCDPPGTTLHRLVVWGEQISPDPVKNTETVSQASAPDSQDIIGPSTSLWGRFTNWLSD